MNLEAAADYYYILAGLIGGILKENEKKFLNQDRKHVVCMRPEKSRVKTYTWDEAFAFSLNLWN